MNHKFELHVGTVNALNLYPDSLAVRNHSLLLCIAMIVCICVSNVNFISFCLSNKLSILDFMVFSISKTLSHVNFIGFHLTNKLSNVNSIGFCVTKGF